MNLDKLKKKTIAVDFDGVIHRYSKGWQDGSIYDMPMSGVRKALTMLNKKFKIVIFSRRAAHQGIKDIKKWLKINKIPYNRVTKVKPRARWYIDDRAIRFTTWKKTFAELTRLEKKYPFRNRK